MENGSSCNIITSHLEDRTTTHEWTDVYLPTSSPVNAVIAYNKRKHKYIAINHLLHHLPTVDLSNYVFFAFEKAHHPDWREIRDFSVIANSLNQTKAELCNRICLNVRCIEMLVEGALPEHQYYYSLPPESMASSLPGFNAFKRFNQYRKKRKKHSS